MDKIAVISDIHGNIPALEAVLADIRKKAITRIYCLGDIVGKGPHSDLAVDRIRQCCPIVVLGNWDDGITKPNELADVKWHQRRLGEERMCYLAQLPYSVDFMLSGYKVRLLHASPHGLYKRVQPWDPVEMRLAMFRNTALTGEACNGGEPDIVGYGDVHKAFVQTLEHRTLFNAGSVGNPLDMTLATYAIMEGDFEGTDPAPFSIQLVRVPYDIEAAIQQAKDEGMPQLEPYIKELRTARYRGLD